ncbi:MAG: hypothetical protein U1E97_11740 [Alphaproteobacteria bacterium]
MLTRQVVIIGNVDAARRLVGHLRLASDQGFSISGIFSDGPLAGPSAIDGIPVLGTVDGLTGYARLHPVHGFLLPCRPADLPAQATSCAEFERCRWR